MYGSQRSRTRHSSGVLGRSRKALSGVFCKSAAGEQKSKRTLPKCAAKILRFRPEPLRLNSMVPDPEWSFRVWENGSQHKGPNRMHGR